MFRNIQINTLVSASFFSIIALFVVLMIASQFQIVKIESDAERITALRAPTANSSASLNTALNASLAALRGWMLIGDEGFLIARQEAWRTMRKNERDLLEFSRDWTNPKNVERLSVIRSLLTRLEAEQLSIEHLANTDENVPSTQILFDSAVPLAGGISDSITKMVEFSKTQRSSVERLALLAAMADFQGSFALSLSDIRAFLLSGEERFKFLFEDQWRRNVDSFQRLKSLSEHMEPFETVLLSEIELIRKKFESLPAVMIASRENEKWNRANFLLKSTAVKTSEELILILGQMVSNQNRLLRDDSRLLKESVIRFQIFQVIFLSLSLILTFVFGRTINRKYASFRQNLNRRNNLIDQNVMMATLDGDGVILDISNSLCRCLKGVKQDFVGTQSNFFLSTNLDSGLYEKILMSLMTGSSWQGEFKRDSQEGEELWLSSNIIPIESEDGSNSSREFHIILEDISDRKRYEEVAVTDKLTSLHNRRKFDAVISNEIKLAKRRKTNLTLAIIDIDFFKKYNDNYGHPAGDAALTRTASVLKSSLKRPDDHVFRLGGEEFAVIFNSLDEEQSLSILQGIRQNVENLKIEHSANEVSEYLTISVGAKLCLADGILDREAIYIEADGALYAAKQTRNTVALV